MFCSSIRQRRELASVIPLLTSATKPRLRGSRLFPDCCIDRIMGLTSDRMYSQDSRHCNSSPNDGLRYGLTTATACQRASALVSPSYSGVSDGDRTLDYHFPHRAIRFDHNPSEACHRLPIGDQPDSKFVHERLPYLFDPPD